MAITLVAIDQDDGANLTSLSMTEPTGTAQNDLLLGFFTRGSNTDDGGWTDPADWTQITLKDETLGNADMQAYIGYKVRGATAGDALTFDFGGSLGGLNGVILAFRGVDTSTPFDVTYAEVSHYNSNSNDVTAAAPAITTVTDGAWVILLQHFAQGVDTVGPPSGYTEVHSSPADVTANHSRHVYIARKEVSSAGTETPGVWTHTDGTTDADGRNFTLALRPAASGSSTTVSPNAAGMSV